jgi:hypothetical protein
MALLRTPEGWLNPESGGRIVELTDQINVVLPTGSTLRFPKILAILPCDWCRKELGCTTYDGCVIGTNCLGTILEERRAA